MAIFQCKSCPKKKTGQPYRCSITYPWLCDYCKNTTSVVTQEVTIVEDRRDKIRSVLHLPPVKYGVMK